MCFGVSKLKKDVFCIDIVWDGGDMAFTIPDEFMGYKVTTLGGYTGTGYPCPFQVEIDIPAIYPDGGEYSYSVCDESVFESEHMPDDEYDILTFSIHLGVNLVNIKYVLGKQYYVRYIEGESIDDYLCKIVYYFTVDEGNPKLYAKNGKLYYRDSNELVTDFFYE